MINPVLEIRQLVRSEWSMLRAARLDALRDSPAAYTSTYTREASLGEDQWRQRFDSAHWVVALDGGEVIGLAGLVGGTMHGDDRYIESTWVAPTHRRRGVLRSLLDRLVEIGRADHRDSLFLWVVGDNHVAQRAYGELGFVSTGEEQPLGQGTGRTERRLRLDVRL